MNSLGQKEYLGYLDLRVNECCQKSEEMTQFRSADKKCSLCNIMVCKLHLATFALNNMDAGRVVQSVVPAAVTV